MLLPRYSLRTILTTVTLCALFFVVTAYAFRGEGWAVVIAVGVISVPVMLCFHFMTYAACRGFLRLVGTEHVPARTSQGAVRVGSEGATENA